MIASTARVATDRPSGYLKQLCEHFANPSQRHSGQEFEVTFDGQEGFIDFAPVITGACRVEARDGELVLEASGKDQGALERVQRIVSKHLSHFGQRDALTVEWNAARLP
jgi:uncharacterized protein